MKWTSALPLMSLVLAGCFSSTSPERQTARMHAFLDPASGVTYNIPMRTLKSALYPIRFDRTADVSRTKASSASPLASQAIKLKLDTEFVSAERLEPDRFAHLSMRVDMRR